MPTGVRRPILALVSHFEQFYCLSFGLEHIILSHMAKHLFLNNILVDQQHGFREKFSCETRLISAIHDWAKGINFPSQTDFILLNFSKAFDSVPHDRASSTMYFRLSCQLGVCFPVPRQFTFYYISLAYPRGMMFLLRLP